MPSIGPLVGEMPPTTAVGTVRSSNLSSIGRKDGGRAGVLRVMCLLFLSVFHHLRTLSNMAILLDEREPAAAVATVGRCAGRVS
ncbi:MAG TPA: hypothetical protein VMS17_03580 [Gemmataceae bacterium]|nr:hypothetical protein [Gemmataceae bacterium]